MQALVMPENDLIEINKLLFRFWWLKKDCNRRAFGRVKRSVLCTDVESGGLNMIDLKDMQAAFSLQWVLQVCKANNADKWSLFPRVLFSCFGSNFKCFHANVNSRKFKGLKLVKSYFWRTVLVNWLDNNHLL